MLSIKNLVVGYDEKIVLEGLSLNCFPGEIHGILGWNGAGKTTFFNAVFGFLPLLRGEVLLNGSAVSRDDLTFLETDPFFYPNLRAREYLQLLSGQKDASLDRWQAIFDLPLNDLVNGYSTGMLKKLAIAGAFLQNRDVLLFDEPFNGLDLEGAEKLSLLLENLKKQGDKIVLISSHILPTLTRLCDKISRLESGKIVETYLPESFGRLENELTEAIRKNLLI